MKVGIVFGTCTGNTEELAEVIRDHLGLEDECLQDVARMEAADLANFDFLIIGIPTWHIGELQDDWYGIHEDLDEVDMTGTQIALFGLGDQLGYSDTFLDGMGILYDKFLERGATGNVGFWPTDGFEFDDSKALKDGQFCGLAIDQDCQPELTDERVEKWCQILKAHLAQKAA